MGYDCVKGGKEYLRLGECGLRRAKPQAKMANKSRVSEGVCVFVG